MARSVTLMVSPDLERQITEVFRTFPQPSVIKPAASGSSVGVTIAKSFGEFAAGVRKAFQHSAQVIVEQFIAGKEATVGVIDRLRGQKHYGLPPVEIVPPTTCTFFNYTAKYGGDSVERCPGNFSRTETDELVRVARLAHEVLDLRHYSRSDFMVTPKGEVYFLESNTLPGLTNESLLPKSLSAVGVSVPQFIDHVVDLAVHKS
jgi:D-alanine-D-alanine ligase